VAREIEWQFDALDLRLVQRWLAAENGRTDTAMRVDAAASMSLVDQYLDTDDWRFRRAGYTLRIRRVGRRRGGEATLKALGGRPEDSAEPRNRIELSQFVEATEPGLLLRATGPVGERVRAVAGKKPLLPLFEVRTRRRTFALALDGLPPAELALDETAIASPESAGAARLRRVEVEVPEPSQAALGGFVARLRDECALQPAKLTKYEAGLLSSDLRPAEAERFGPTEVGPDLQIGAVALAVLRRHFATMLANEPGTRLGDDIEDLHDMRVATRRLRAALSLFADALPPGAATAREELGWIGASLGAVRDLDVQLEQLDVWRAEVPAVDRDALAALGALLHEQRFTARAALLEALDSRRYESFVGRFGRMLRARRARLSGPAAAPSRAVAPDLIEQRFSRFRKRGNRIGPGSPADDYHAVRIQAKRLRYTLEFLADLYPGGAKPLVRRLTALQDVLGLHQDADVAIERLRALAAERGDDLGPATIFAMGEIAERYRNEMFALRRQFPAAYAAVAGKRWKQFRARLEELRPTPDAVEAAPPEPSVEAAPGDPPPA
jgi:triphosphatase